jgi:hypothetical protein
VDGKALRAARLRARLSSSQAGEALTEASGVSVGSRRVLYWETGETQPPEWAVKELARIYRVPQKELWA